VRQSGYVLELAETCDNDNPFQLITDYDVEPNITTDIEIIQDRLQGIKETTGCEDMIVDGGFYSPNVIEKATDHEIEMHFTGMTGLEPSKKMLPVSEFVTDEKTKIILRCPADRVPMRALVKDGQSIAHFDHSDCDKCELLQHCHSIHQKKHHLVRISLKAFSACSERAKVKEYKKVNTSKRAAIEGSNSALKRMGLKKLRVRGMAKCQVVCGLKVAAQNIKRFTKYLQGGYEPKIKEKPKSRILVPIST
jgi:hypothetical protein